LFLSFYDFMHNKKRFWGIGIGLIFLVFMVIKLFKYDFPVKKNAFQGMIKSSVDYTNKYSAKNIHYLHPLIPFFNGSSILESKNGYHQTFIMLSTENLARLKPGDLIIRDSKFGPVEQGMKLDDLKKLPYIIPVKHFYENTSDIERNGESSSIIIYQVFDSLDPRIKRFGQTSSFNRKKLLIPNKRFSFKNCNEEYPNINQHFELPKLIGPQQKLVIHINEIHTSEQIYFIFTDRKGTDITLPIDMHSKTIEIPFAVGQKTGLFFIHNPSKKTFSIDFELRYWEQLKDIGIQTLTK
jgi:hypothetical protein